MPCSFKAGHGASATTLLRALLCRPRYGTFGPFASISNCATKPFTSTA